MEVYFQEFSGLKSSFSVSKSFDFIKKSTCLNLGNKDTSFLKGRLNNVLLFVSSCSFSDIDLFEKRVVLMSNNGFSHSYIKNKASLSSMAISFILLNFADAFWLRKKAI